MEKKEDGIFVSNVFLESMKKSLLHHCQNNCKLFRDGVCSSCNVYEVLDDLTFIEEYSGEDYE